MIFELDGYSIHVSEDEMWMQHSDGGVLVSGTVEDETFVFTYSDWGRENAHLMGAARLWDAWVAEHPKWSIDRRSPQPPIIKPDDTKVDKSPSAIWYGQMRSRYRETTGNDWEHVDPFNCADYMKSSAVQEIMMRSGIESRHLMPAHLGENVDIANAIMIFDQLRMKQV